MTERIQDICSCCIFVLHRGIKLHFFLYNATQMNIIVYSENNVFTGNLDLQGFPHDMYNGFESRLALFCFIGWALIHQGFPAFLYMICHGRGSR